MSTVLGDGESRSAVNVGTIVARSIVAMSAVSKAMVLGMWW